MYTRATAMGVFAAMNLVCASAFGAQGDCSQPISAGDRPIASDCLFILRTAVGSEACPECVCDTNGASGVTASDALVCLKKAVGQDVALSCICVDTTTTTTATSTSTTTSTTTTSTTTTTSPATTTTTVAVCGDDTCNGDETCATCASECGACNGCAGAPDDTTSLDADEQDFLGLLNEYRAANGAGAVAVCTSLSRAAQGHSEDMRDQDYFDHVGLDGSTFYERACAACFDFGCGPQVAMAQDIAAGNSGAQATLDQWKGIPGDDANLRNADYVSIGIGRAPGGGTYGVYWTLLFAAGTEPSCN